MPLPLIELRNVYVRREKRTILENVDLCVDKGDFLAITGPNGGGKTTLLRVMLKLLPPTSGSVTYYDEYGNGRVVPRLDIGYLPQKNSIDSRFPLSVREVIGTGLPPSLGMSVPERRIRVNEVLLRLQLESHADAPIGEISGGQLQRALLGRAIISHPTILILDEPLSYLDRHFIKETYTLLEELAQYTTIVLVSHEMSAIADMANRHVLVDHVVKSCHAHSHHFMEPPCDV